ncbi:hypothetical protein [Oceanisphaera sp.]|uniref:hypothetical protein n=1 Tax=Oceanisphaera sp. TaxID=1929979 RepID=UPI003A9324DA
MKKEVADKLVKMIIILEAVAMSVILLLLAWLTFNAEPGQQAVQGPWLWLLLPLMVLSWLWLCQRAWYGYLSSEGMRRQWPFWMLVAVQLPSFPLGTLMGGALIFLKIKYRPRAQ